MLALNTSVSGSLSLTTTRTSPNPTCGVVSGKGEEIWQLDVSNTMNVTLTTASPPTADGGTLDTILNLRSSCATSTDLACNDDQSTSVRTSRLARTLSPGTYFAIVQEYDAPTLPAVGGVYTLSATASPVASNATCATAIPLQSGVPLTNQNSAGAGDPSAACATTAGGQLFYSATVNAGQRLSVTLTPTGTSPVSHVVRLLSGCSATSCLRNLSGASPSVVSWDNDTGATQTIIVSVSAASPGTSGTFDLVATTGGIPAGETCAAPTPIVSSGTINGTTTGATNDVGTSTASNANCTGFSNTGADRVYSVSVPAGTTLIASVYGGTWDPALYVIGSPASNCTMSSSCLAAADQDGSGVTDTLSWTNPGAATTVFIVVDNYNDSGRGDFTLTVNLTTAAPGYTKTTIAPGCVDVSAGASVPLVNSSGSPDFDDGYSAAIALPFSFAYWGLPVTHYTVNANGFAQLWSTPSPTLEQGTARYANVTMPNPATPNSLVAPFWDDLLNTGPTSVLTLLTGAAPSRRLVVEWFDVAPYSSTAPVERMRFQAHLSETSNVIEFHYCELNAGGGARGDVVTGNSATVGLENQGGSAAVLHSFSQANAVSTSSALRFTP